MISSRSEIKSANIKIIYSKNNFKMYNNQFYHENDIAHHHTIINACMHQLSAKN